MFDSLKLTPGAGDPWTSQCAGADLCESRGGADARGAKRRAAGVPWVVNGSPIL
jgi:hypothetical protein